MRYLLLGPAFPLRGGIANFNTALYNEIIQQENTAEIVSFSLQYPNVLFPGKTQFEEGIKPENLKVTALINSINPFSWIKTIKYIIKQKPEVIVVQFWMPFFSPAFGTILRFVKKKISVKVIAVIHNYIPHEKRFGDNFLLKYFTNNIDAFIALSKSVSEDIKKDIPEKSVCFSPHPVYNIFGDAIPKIEAKKKLQLAEDKNYLLFFGIVRKYKGLELLLKAFAQTDYKSLNLNLIIAGEFYDNKEDYLNLIKELKLIDNIHFSEGFIPSENVKLFFSAADMVVQPYITATQSGVTQIAYHFNIPMLVTNVGGLSEIVPDNKVGYVCEKSPEIIAQAITDFYLNNRAGEFVNNIKTEKKRFSWDTFYNSVKSLVNEL